MTPLETVRALIAKALSTESEEEARTCALTAIRIMHAHQLDVVVGDPAARNRYEFCGGCLSIKVCTSTRLGLLCAACWEALR